MRGTSVLWAHLHETCEITGPDLTILYHDRELFERGTKSEVIKRMPRDLVDSACRDERPYNRMLGALQSEQILEKLHMKA